MDEVNKAILQAHQGMDFGTVMVFIKKHEGKVSTVDAQKLYVTPTPRGNEQAIETVTTLIKGMNAACQSGDLTFTISMQKGVSRKIQVQDMKRIDFINKG